MAWWQARLQAELEELAEQTSQRVARLERELSKVGAKMAAASTQILRKATLHGPAEHGARHARHNAKTPTTMRCRGEAGMQLLLHARGARAGATCA